MMETNTSIDENYCGTPFCHGGWYLIAKGVFGYDNSYSDGARMMASDLGFEDVNSLKRWAKENIKIWGNEYGENMFSDENAFGRNLDTGFTLKPIINHWKRVKQRALKYAQ